MKRQFDTRTASLEGAIMDMSDDGLSVGQIAERLGESFSNVRRVHGYMCENSSERTFARETRAASARHAAAVLATGGRYA